METGRVVLHRDTARTPSIVAAIDGWLIFLDDIGVHGIQIDGDGEWTKTAGPTMASESEGRILVASKVGVGLLSPTGDVITWSASGVALLPQERPVLVGRIVLVPGWEGTVAIDLDTGVKVAEWLRESYERTISFGAKRALVGIAGDGLHMVEHTSP